MGTCAICGQKAGLFTSVHSRCQEARVAALKSIREAVKAALVGEEHALRQLARRQDLLSQERRLNLSPEEAIKFEKTSAGIAEAMEVGRVVLEELLGKPNLESLGRTSPRMSGFWDRCADVMNQGHLLRGLAVCRDAVIDGWLDAAGAFLEYNAQSGVNASVLAAMKAGDVEFGLSDREERLTEARNLLRLSRIRTQVSSREPIEKVPFEVIPAQGEGILWTLSPSTYSRQVSISTHTGGFGGVSVRVAPGLYVRSGGYGGESRPTHRLEPVGAGTVAMSNLQTWFKCGQEITRIPHDRLISTQGFTDAFSLTPSTGSPVFFSLPESQRFPGILGSLLVGLATDLAAIVKNRTPPVKFA